MENYSSKGFTWISKLIVALLLLVISAAPVLATGSGHKHHDKEMSEHMQSMMAVKESIPDEYQIMERTPIPPSDESLQQGRKLFLQNCSVCHGADGDGKGPAAIALETPPANFLDKKHSAMYGPGEKYWIIGHGTERTGMPAFMHLAPIDRWHLVNHILQLQKSLAKEHKDHVNE
jgi:mono/diheme cytochrome c family protein